MKRASRHDQGTGSETMVLYKSKHGTLLQPSLGERGAIPFHCPLPRHKGDKPSQRQSAKDRRSKEAYQKQQGTIREPLAGVSQPYRQPLRTCESTRPGAPRRLSALPAHPRNDESKARGCFNAATRSANQSSELRPLVDKNTYPPARNNAGPRRTRRTRCLLSLTPIRLSSSLEQRD